MEKKTMGSFLAALRRANGMTQKELAERLNVSDKSVSRWERDDGAPDLALIPVIAEVFGVTCDELLRGERAAAGEGRARSPRQRQSSRKSTCSRRAFRAFARAAVSRSPAPRGLPCRDGLQQRAGAGAARLLPRRGVLCRGGRR